MAIEGNRAARRCAAPTLPAPRDASSLPPYDGLMGGMDEAERLEPVSLEAWSHWLAGHHGEARGVWLISRRRAADRVFSYEEGVLEALRYGWVGSLGSMRPG